MSVRRALGLFVALVVAMATAPKLARASVASEELVRQAREHEAQHDDDVAAARYSEALRLEPTSAAAYLGLGALRLRHADFREAERVFAVAIEQVAGLRLALAGLARARWGLGRHTDAEETMESYLVAEPGDADALREIAAWYGADARPPAQLAAWRRLLVLAAASNDATRVHEARSTVRALQLLVGLADPVTSPIAPNATRAAIARVARRGG
jgi:tetratricopeptide (TPR) repeat protein